MDADTGNDPAVYFAFLGANSDGVDYAIYLLETHQGKGIGRRLALSVAQRLAQLNIHSLLVWVLADNPACRFYEALGGKNVYEKQIELGKEMLDEIAYGWTDTTVLGLGQ